MIESITGPGESLRDALWETGNTINQSHVLWYDPTPQWAPGVAYRWRIQHDPDSGRIRVRWYEVSAFLFFSRYRINGLQLCLTLPSLVLFGPWLIVVHWLGG